MAIYKRHNLLVRMLLGTTVVCAAWTLCTTAAFADPMSGKIGEEGFSFSYEDGVLVIDGSSANDGASFTMAQAKSSITIDTIGANLTDVKTVKFTNVKKIPNQLFYQFMIPARGGLQLKNLEKVDFGGSVEEVGTSAFQLCKSLKEVSGTNSLKTVDASAFESCTSLSAFENSAGLSEVGKKGFFNTAITNLTPFAGVTEYGESAFGTCRSLTDVSALSSSLTSIPKGMFSKCSSLTSVSLPTNVTSIGEDAFGECTALTSAPLPSTLENMPKNLFYKCPSLRSIDIPTSVKTIGDSALLGCSSLESVAVPASVESIGTGVFQECDSLTSVTFAEGSNLSSLGMNSFRDCNKLTSLDLSKTKLTVIADQPFQCDNLKSIMLPSTLTTIGQAAFTDCKNLEELVLPLNVSGAIGDCAFQNCKKLTTLLIPSGVTSIGANAFSGCPSLEYLYVPATLTSLADSASRFGQKDTVLPLKIIVYGGISCPAFESFDSNAYSGLVIDGAPLYPQVAVDAAKSFVVGSLDSNDAYNTAKDAYDKVKEAYDNLSAEELAAITQDDKDAAKAALDDAAAKLTGYKPSTPSGGGTGGSTGGSGGGGGSVAPTPSQHEHFWGTGVETVKATCAAAGTMTYHCTVSGCTETKTEAIPALGHKFGEWVVTTPATTQAAGVETRTCSVCGATETRAIDKIADGSGSGSGTVTPSGDKVTVGTTVKVSGITYKVTASGKVKVSAVSKSVKGKKTVTIPATVKVKGKTYKVAGVSAKILKGAKATTLVIKSKTLTKKGVKNSLKGSKVKTVKIVVSGKRSVNKTYVSKYKKFFTKANCGKSVKLLAA